MARAAIILFNDRGLETARRVQAVLPGSEIFGYAGRVGSADQFFSSAPDTFQRLYGEGREIIGLCAVGIIVRSLAPILSDKRVEPPVIAVSDDGALVIPLLGGLAGGNELAARLAETLDGLAAITASGSRRLGLQLEAPPEGYSLANPQDAKAVTARLIAGEVARLEGSAPFIAESNIPLSDDGTLTIRTSHLDEAPPDGGLLYHPRSVLIAPRAPQAVAVDGLRQALKAHRIAEAALAAIILPEGEDATASVREAAHSLQRPIRYVGQPSQSDGPLGALPVAVEATINAAGFDIAILRDPSDLGRVGRAQGQLSVVGLGPGDGSVLTGEARDALIEADHLVGYQTYLDLVPVLRPGQKRHASGNRVEIERAREALDLALRGERVAVVSSGDPGIFAMASAVMEALEQSPGRWRGIDIEILPGVSAMQAAAARIGAPLGHDFCAISLSDIRKPWERVERRLIAALEADFVIAIYNPASQSRREQIERAKELMLQHLAPTIPVVVGRNLSRDGESVEVVALKDLEPKTIDMRTLLIVGSSQTRTFRGPGETLFAYTPRSYD